MRLTCKLIKIMDLEKLFNKKKHKQNIDELELIYPLPKEYVDILNIYDVENIVNRDAKIYFNNGIDNFIDFVYLNGVFDKHKINNINTHFYTIDVDKTLIESELLIIGDTSASLFICIGIGVQNWGEIFLYGWDIGVIEISETIYTFFDSLS